MIKWLTIPENTKRNAYNQIAERRGMSPFAVEKDWWVMQTLTVIFEMEVGRHLIFKGGTSLSKAWKLIERFSEDIDLVINRDYLGYPGALMKKEITNLRKTAGEYTSGKFLDELQRRLADKGFSDLRFNLVDAKNSDQDPRIIEIFYPHVIEPPGYLQARVQIEIGCRSLREPNTIKSFSSLLDEEYPDSDFAQPPVSIPVVNPERTFLEKIFLLHEEFHRPPHKIRVDRLSRHLYDVAKLSKTEYADKALADPDLYSIIVDHRYKFTRVGGVNYNLLQPQTIDPIPVPEAIEAWRADYNKMVVEMFYEVDPPSFDQIIAQLNELKNKINTLPWKFDQEYPIPNS
jgi:hypothetical protein